MLCVLVNVVVYVNLRYRIHVFPMIIRVMVWKTKHRMIRQTTKIHEYVQSKNCHFNCILDIKNLVIHWYHSVDWLTAIIIIFNYIILRLCNSKSVHSSFTFLSHIFRFKIKSFNSGKSYILATGHRTDLINYLSNIILNCSISFSSFSFFFWFVCHFEWVFICFNDYFVWFDWT